ncbi:MAG: DUF1641 domain-containing protein [Actinomycetota bacterium]|nr:DUF1641 domain-containing protein [Actinomycetota bacterium]
MTTATTPVTTDERLDLLTAQVQLIADELRREREQRERWSELVQDMAPVTSEAFAAVSRELEDLSDDVTVEDLARFGRTMARALPTMEALLAQLQSLSDLSSEVVPLASPAMATLTTTLQDLEEKGYFAFARSGAGIVDRVVTSFSEEDVEALGDNVVLILNTVKEMTQPEVMTLLQRTAVTVQEVEDEHAEPPSLLALLKQMRDPQTRRGLGRALTMLRSVGEDKPAEPNSPHEGR